MVSIIMPAYNSEKVIKKAINSVLQQTYTDWELIIVDDGSSDNTFVIASKYAKKCKKIRCIKNFRKKGVSGARNSGILKARGSYIAFLDSDDQWFDCHLSECMEALKKYNYSFCSALWCENHYGEIFEIGKSGWFNIMFDQMKEKLGVDRQNRVWLFENNLFEYILETEFYCFHINTIIVKKSILNQCGGFNENMKTSEDLELIYRILQLTNLLTVNNYHFMYNYGVNNAYAFCLRNELSVAKLRQKNIAKKLTLNVIGKIQLNQKMKIILKNSRLIKNKKELTISINQKIYDRYLTCIWLNKRRNIFICIYSYLKSLKYAEYINDHTFLPTDEYMKKHLCLD